MGVDSKTNKLFLVTATRDVGDNEEEVKLVEMLSDSLGVWFVVESGITEAEKKRWNLKFYGGFKGTIFTIAIANLTRKKY